LAINSAPIDNGSSITGNAIDGGGIAIDGVESLGLGQPPPLISGNYISSAPGDGIFAQRRHFSLNPTISDNVLVGNGGDGIHVENPVQVTVGGNVAVANAGFGIEALGAIDGGGNLASGNGNPLQCVGVSCGPAWPEIDVTPLQYDFGAVDLGTSSVQIVTVSNVGGSTLVVGGLEILRGSDPGFALEEAPTLPVEIEPGETLDVAVTFSPSTGDEVYGTLRITSNDNDDPTVDVALSGTGVTYEKQAMELLDFFDAAVAAGEITGNGPSPKAASLRLTAFRNMLEASGDILQGNHPGAACTLLEVARRRADGVFPPPDFVAGDGLPALEDQIEQLRTNVGCGAVVGPHCGLGSELVFLIPPLAWLRSRRRQ